MKNYTLCALHEPSSHAYLILEGKLTIHNDDFEIVNFPVKSLLVGTFELLLAQDLDTVPNRKLQIEVLTKKYPQKIPLTSVEDMFLHFDTGKIVNKFLALMVDRTNDVIMKFAQNVSWRTYQAAAHIFAKQVTALTMAYKTYPLDAIENVIRALRKLHIVRYGIQSRHTSMLLAIEANDLQTTQQKVLQAQKGDVLCEEGEPAESMFVLLKGDIAITKSDRLISTVKKPGEAFGEISFFLEGKRTAHAIARSETTYLSVQQSDLPDFHEKHPLLFFEIARTLSKRIEANLQEIHVMKAITSSPIDSILRRYSLEFVELLRPLKNHSGIPELVKISKDTQDGLKEWL